MERRSVVAAAAGLFSLGLVGYLRLPGAVYRLLRAQPLSIDGSGTALAPGEDGTVSVTADNVSAMGYDAAPDPDVVSVDITGAKIEPAPDLTWTADPPSYRWDSPSAIRATWDVSVAEGADSGDYQFGITVRHSTPSGEDKSAAITLPITVLA